MKIIDQINRRHRRQRRRRNVGRAYDMALEVARFLPRGARVLDVGCGSGFIAHHLSALLATPVTGIDVTGRPAAQINYKRFDGVQVPFGAGTFDAALLCYVLHHARDVKRILKEVNRVLKPGARVIIYEDIPGDPLDRFVCWTHDMQWRKRTGHCSFRHAKEWRKIFDDCGFDVTHERPLSRWRNLAHPVRRRFYVLKRREVRQNAELISGMVA